MTDNMTAELLPLPESVMFVRSVLENCRAKIEAYQAAYGLAYVGGQEASSLLKDIAKADANLSARPVVGDAEDAARWRKVRGMSLADVCVIFNPGMDRDGRNVMRQRDNRVDRLMQPLAAITKEPK